MAKMRIHSDKDYKEFDGAAADLREHHQGPFGIGNSYNDRIVKIGVESGVWRLFEHINFEGEHRDYGPGVHYDDFLRKVSSFSIVG